MRTLGNKQQNYPLKKPVDLLDDNLWVITSHMLVLDFLWCIVVLLVQT